MPTINKKELDVKDINARIQAMALKRRKGDAFYISPYRETHLLLKKRRGELNDTTLGMLVEGLADCTHFYGRDAVIMFILFPLFKEKHLDMLYHGRDRNISQYMTAGPKEWESRSYHYNEDERKKEEDIERQALLDYKPEDDPFHDTIYTMKYTLDGFIRDKIIRWLDPEQVPMHLKRYPQDVDRITAGADNLDVIQAIVDNKNSDSETLEHLCENESPILGPLQMRVLNEGRVDMDQNPVYECLVRLLKRGYKLQVTPPETNKEEKKTDEQRTEPGDAVVLPATADDHGTGIRTGGSTDSGAGSPADAQAVVPGTLHSGGDNAAGVPPVPGDPVALAIAQAAAKDLILPKGTVVVPNERIRNINNLGRCAYLVDKCKIDKTDPTKTNVLLKLQGFGRWFNAREFTVQQDGKEVL